MFQFPRCPLRDRSQSARPCAGRVAPFGHPRIAGCQRLPGAFRRVAASFIGRQRQGIHHAPIMRMSCATSPPGPVVDATADRRAPAGWSRPATAIGPRPRLRGASVGVGVYLSLVCDACFSARGRADTSPQGLCRLPRPQNPAGSAWRIVKVHSTTHRSSQDANVLEVVKPRPKAAPALGRTLPPARGQRRRWSLRPRLACWRDEGGLPPSPGGAAGIRTPDLRRARAALSQLSYGPRCPGPPGGRAWTRTRDLGLIRAAL